MQSFFQFYQMEKYLNKTQNISVVILTFNEDKNIERAIMSAKKISDDIIVSDSFSTDNTPLICKKYKVTFIQNQWLGYGAQRNLAVKQSKCNWILCLDADEVIPDKLAKEIQTLKLENEKIIYSFKRLNNFCGKWIKYGLWGRDKVRRLYNKQTSEWNNEFVHESLKVSNSHEIKILKNYLHHYSYNNELELKEKTQKYAMLAAQNMLSKGKQAGFFALMFRPFFKFVVNYIFRLGFLDGKAGFTIAQYQFKETFLKYQHLRKYNHTNK